MSIDSREFAYALDEPQPKVALVLLKTDEVLEQEAPAWLADNIVLSHTRVENAPTINADSLQQMQAALPAALNLLPAEADYSVVAYGCTSGTTLIGEERVAAIVHDVFPGARVTNPLTAIKARLQDLQVQRVSLLTPYQPDVTAALADHLSAAGVNIVACGTFNEPLDAKVCRIAAQSIQSAASALVQHSASDAVVVSCTNLRTAGWLDSFSEQLGVPMLSSNSALCWHINRLLQRA